MTMTERRTVHILPPRSYSLCRCIGQYLYASLMINHHSQHIIVTMDTWSALSTFQLLVITVITLGLIKLVVHVRGQFAHWQKKVPHIKGIPVFGSPWKFYFQRVSFVEYIQSVYDRYQDARYVGTIDFSTPVFVLRDPELIREVAIKSFEQFPDHRTFLSEEMDPIFGKNVFSLRGDRWREMRNTLSPSFTASKMRFMFELVSKCASNFVGHLYEHPEVCSSIEGKNIFTRYTNDVIATVAFGISVNSLKHQDNEFYKNGVDITSTFTSVRGLLKLLVARASPRFSRKVGISVIPRSSTKFFWNTIAETVSTRDRQGIIRQDMLHLLMQARDKDKSPTDPAIIDDIVAQAFIFFLAGFDTSSTLMSYIAYELAVNQDVQDRLRAEIDRYLAEGNGEITYEALSRMEYMEMVISETLRMYPPVLVIDRLCWQKFQLPPAGSGYESVTLEPDDMTWFPVYALHHDPKYFPDPEKFDPERFSEKNKENIVPYTYIPFGVGPRQCIGNRFALMETKILMVHLLSKFILKPNSRTSIPLVFRRTGFTLIPEDGCWIKLEKREV